MRLGVRVLAASWFLGCGGVPPAAVEWPAAKPPRDRLSVEPSTVELAVGRSRALVARRIDAAGRVQDVTASVRWLIADARVARLDWKGAGPVLEALAVGTTAVEAIDGEDRASSTVAVTPAELEALRLEPTTLTLSTGRSAVLSAVARYSDGTTRLVSAEARFRSTQPSVAEVQEGGQLMAKAAGSALLTATFGGLQAFSEATITPAQLTAIVVRPATPTLTRGESVAFTAEGVFSDGSRADLTSSARWATSNSFVVALTGSLGLARAGGASVVGATVDNITGSTLATVIGEQPVALELLPLSPIATPGTTRQLLALATWPDGSTEDVTHLTTFSTADPRVADLVADGHHRGMVTVRAPGAVVLTAQAGSLWASTTLLVTSGNLTGVSLVAPHSLRVGQSARLVVLGRFSDGSTLDLTSRATWKNSRPELMATSNELGSKGAVDAVGAGTTHVTVEVLGRSATVGLTVTP